MQNFGYDAREMTALDFKRMHVYSVGHANIKHSPRRYSRYHAQDLNCKKMAGRITKN